MGGQKGSALVVVVIISALISLLVLRYAEQIELTVKANQAGLVGIQQQLDQLVDASIINQCIALKQSSCGSYGISLLGEDDHFAYYRLQSKKMAGQSKIFAVTIVN
ncbi:hypothetical protein [Piscirickettsia litoralis]|uniref:hypothetical protein n=1 Tax=Piscirickettsia litoralis TaxID=1891921 RepID=UPI001F3685EC|nr:hypothetical protein [Piscirickettsia litoralis]